LIFNRLRQRYATTLARAQRKYIFVFIILFMETQHQNFKQMLAHAKKSGKISEFNHCE